MIFQIQYVESIIPLIENINPYMITIHATGGEEMLTQVVKVVSKKPKKIRPILLGGNSFDLS